MAEVRISTVVMHSRSNSRTATKVKNGRVQRKNRGTPTGHRGYVLDREQPGRGHRHVVTKRDVQAFIDLIPEWDRFSERLERIVLAAQSEGDDGLYIFYHREESGVICLHAWPDDLWLELPHHYFAVHQTILERLGVACDPHAEGVTCRFAENQARAFTLLHVFMHELGHHFDRIHQKHLGATKGEDYAESFANSRFEQLLPGYERVFGPLRFSPSGKR